MFGGLPEHFEKLSMGCLPICWSAGEYERLSWHEVRSEATILETLHPIHPKPYKP